MVNKLLTNKRYKTMLSKAWKKFKREHRKLEQGYIIELTDKEKAKDLIAERIIHQLQDNIYFVSEPVQLLKTDNYLFPIYTTQDLITLIVGDSTYFIDTITYLNKKIVELIDTYYIIDTEIDMDINVLDPNLTPRELDRQIAEYHNRAFQSFLNSYTYTELLFLYFIYINYNLLYKDNKLIKIKEWGDSYELVW